MLGHFATIDGQVVDKPPLVLHKNFYRAISEAQQAISGRVIAMSPENHWALVGNDEASPVRVLISKD